MRRQRVKLCHVFTRPTTLPERLSQVGNTFSGPSHSFQDLQLVWRQAFSNALNCHRRQLRQVSEVNCWTLSIQMVQVGPTAGISCRSYLQLLKSPSCSFKAFLTGHCQALCPTRGLRKAALHLPMCRHLVFLKLRFKAQTVLALNTRLSSRWYR